MYGGEEFNSHLLLRYGYTKDLFDRFQPLVYKGVELPLNMLRPYHVFIREVVDKYHEDQEFMAQKMRSWRFRSMRDVQQELSRIPIQEENWGQDHSRDMILMCGQFVDLALSQFSDRKVLLLHSNPYDLNTLSGKELPPGFQVFSVHEHVLLGKAQPEMINHYYGIVNELTSLSDKAVAEHEIFSLPRFPEWMRSQVRQGLTLVDILDDLLHRYPIGIILDHSELIYPGSILSLLARKYGLPFINVQNHLTSDASIIPSRATHYAVFGKHMADWLLRRGIQAEQIHAVGSLRMENNEQRIKKTRDALVQQYGMKDVPFIITFTTEFYDETINFRVMKWLQNAVKDLPILVVIKPHPSDKLSYEKYLSKWIRLAPADFDLQEILYSSDFIATISSSTAIEAVMLNKGIIVMLPKLPYDYHINYNGYPYFLAKAKAGIVIRTADDARSEIRRLYKEQSYREDIVQRGQHFLDQTLTSSVHKPSYLIRQLVDDYFRNR